MTKYILTTIYFAIINNRVTFLSESDTRVMVDIEK